MNKPEHNQISLKELITALNEELELELSQLFISSERKSQLIKLMILDILNQGYSLSWSSSTKTESSSTETEQPLKTLLKDHQLGTKFSINHKELLMKGPTFH